MNSRIKELKESRAAAHAKAVEFLKVNPQTVESRDGYKLAMADVDAMGTDISNIEQADRVAAELATIETRPLEGAPASTQVRTAEEVKEFAAKYRVAFADMLRNGAEPGIGKSGHSWRGLSAASREVMAKVEELRAKEPSPEAISRMSMEQRDQSEGTLLSQIGTYTGLGFFVPAGFVYQIEQATKYFAPLLDGSVLRIMETATGQPLPYPTSDDTSQKAVLVAENAQVANKDVTASHINFGAWKYTSGLVRVSFELLQDSAFDLEKWLAERFGERWGRGMEDALTNGTGSSQPNGILTAIAAAGGPTTITAVGSAESTGGSQTGQNSVGNTDLVDLEHSVDPTYRRNARYMFHDKTLASLRKILDKFGRPLWAPSVREGDPDKINGYPYTINQSMPQIAAGNVTVVFGAFDKFMVRKVKDLQILRLTERYADFGQVAFVSFARIDSNLLDAGTHPLNTLTQKA